jgi:ABC-type sugar transport system permease subunit
MFPRFRFTYRNRLSVTGFLFVLPVLLYFAIFAFWPMINAFYLSLFNYDMLTPKEFIGLENYQSLLDSPTFLSSLKTTAIYAFGVSIPLWFFSLITAMLLNQKLRLRTLFRAIFFSPMVMPLVILAVIWSLLYHPFGPINSVILSIFTKDLPAWLKSGQHALLAVIIMAIWRATGYYAVVFLAGLQNVPNEFYEAAKLDGASGWAVFWNITWPLLRPTTLFVVVVSIINALRHFDAIWVMTGGGPGDATRVLAVLIYETGLTFLKMGKASAMSVVLFVFVMMFTVIQLRLFRSEVNY